MKIIRVFPRRTKATPTDECAFVGKPQLLWPRDAEEVHVSVAFTWDLACAYDLAEAWAGATGLRTFVGGPGLGGPGGVFTPGMYLKPGYVITSRGCPNECWFCSVPGREGDLLELPITDGWNVIDDNLLACSPSHIEAVFDMLARQNRRPEFTGGLEAARLERWHVERLRELNPNRMYFAYDTPGDLPPLQDAGKLLKEHGFKRESHRVCSYILIGYGGDTFERAEKRISEAWDAGFWPFAMLYRDERGKRDPDWASFQRKWVRPQLVKVK